jgi:aminomethyltransferase
MPDEEAVPSGAEETPGAAAALAELHRSLGGEIERGVAGLEVAAHYGSPLDEHRLLRRSCGVADRSWMPALQLTGEDRARFLNGLATCDVKTPSSGQGCYGFLTDAKGKILADVAILVEEERLLLELPPGRARAIAEHLQKYIIADRVEVNPIDDEVGLAVVGPAARQRLEALVGEDALPEHDWEHRRVSLLGREVLVCQHPRLGAAGFLMRAPAAAAADLFGDLVRHRASGEVTAVGYLAMEMARVEEGLPLLGVDLGEDTLPQETGFVEAVSYTKGCYLGQEVVARIHYRGHVNRHLRGVVLEGDGLPPAGAAVTLDGEGVGTVTSPVRSPELGRPIALSLIHRKASDPGTRVEVESSGGAEVTELPFVRTGVA